MIRGAAPIYQSQDSNIERCYQFRHISDSSRAKTLVRRISWRILDPPIHICLSVTSHYYRSEIRQSRDRDVDRRRHREQILRVISLGSPVVPHRRTSFWPSAATRSDASTPTQSIGNLEAFSNALPSHDGRASARWRACAHLCQQNFYLRTFHRESGTGRPIGAADPGAPRSAPIAPHRKSCWLVSRAALVRKFHCWNNEVGTRKPIPQALSAVK
ncbi:hypothetical protein EAI_12456 [Harpegnathos saltator]|uniref:Uncharacterized protein n=1 Tax=Harpegnathos saltator TaxID=610380 RepID=E2BXU2_HARSA|nr:hypothetical protein EAI_12456 [Harpegnathos saltator]